MTRIEWTDETWNPVVGCSIVSPGCTNCYAMTMARRLAANSATPHYAGTVKTVNGNPVWTGKIGLADDETLMRPWRWKKPRMIFVNSMGDLFHESVPDEVIDRVFAIMALARQHTYQVLTKRAARMRNYLMAGADDGVHRAIGTAIRRRAIFRAAVDLFKVPTASERTQKAGWPLNNVWLGVSAERQEEADARVPILLDTPAKVRFVSAEPLLGPIDFRAMQQHAAWSLDWIIVGGESGPGARPMRPEWARSIRDDCAETGVPFFFKQWGGWAPLDRGAAPDTMFRCTKKIGGRLLDGRTHDAMPET